jgi:hypothetical protein
MTEYDTTQLAKLGARRTQLRAELKQVNEQIAEEVPQAAQAGIIQADLARVTGMTRESIAQLCLPADRRWRRKRGTPGD